MTPATKSLRIPISVLGTASALSFALQSYFVRRASLAGISESEVIFFRSFIVVFAAVGLGLWMGHPLRGGNRRLLMTRALLSWGALMAYAYSIHHLKLGEAVLINQLSALMVIVAAPFVLRERPSIAVWIAFALGFAGMAVVVLGKSDGHTSIDFRGVVVGITGAAMAAIIFLSVRRLSRTDKPVAVLAWTSAGPTILCAISGGNTFVMPHGTVLLDLLLVGIFATLGQLALLQAYATGEASRVSIYSYAMPVFSYLLGLVGLRESPGWDGIVGVLCTLAAGAIVALARTSAPPPAGSTAPAALPGKAAPPG